MLFKFKKVDSPLCGFCQKELETIEHLFFHCTKVCQPRSHGFSPPRRGWAGKDPLLGGEKPWERGCKVCMFWDELKVVLNSLNILVRFDIRDVPFGILDTDNISILVNYILFESKYFIYRYKLKKGLLCMRLVLLLDKF